MLLLRSPHCFAEAFFGQTYTGNITGLITDPSGSRVVGAQVVLLSEETGEKREVGTNESGRYTFSQILPATYTIRVSMEGFREFVRTGFELTTNRTMELNAQLEVGQITQAVEVTGAAPTIDTQTADNFVSIDSRTVEEIPMETRNPLDLVYTQAGAVAQNEDLADAAADQNHNRFSMDGGRSTGTQIMVDGVPTVGGAWGGSMVVPGLSSVREMQIVKNTYDAQYGKTSGSVLNITTKGGSQSFHGGVFESLQNDNLNANSFFNNLQGRDKTESKRNQFGANINGPIWKSKKLYGQFGYEGLRQTDPAELWTTVPRENQRRGDFSDTRVNARTPASIFDPFSTRPDPARPGKYIRDQFPDNTIPASRLDKVAMNVVKMYPLPNQPGDAVTFARNFYATDVSSTRLDRYDYRLDWARSERHTAFVRMTKADQFGSQAQFFDRFAETNRDGGEERYHITLHNTFLVSPTMVANVLLGGARWVEKQISKGYGFDFTTLGFPTAFASQVDVPTPPVFTVNGQRGLGNSRHLISPQTTANAQVNFSKEFRSHSLKFGGGWDAGLQNILDSTSATFGFTQVATRGPDPDVANATSGYGLASLLLGTGNSGNSAQASAPAAKSSTWSWYIQDSWRATSRLTVNLGLRHEIQMARTERYNRNNYFDPNAINPIGARAGMPNLKGALVFLNDNVRGAWNTPYRDIAPRVSIAYKITDRLVVRSGYGIYYLRASNSAAKASADGFAATTPWVSTIDSGRTYNDLLSNPFPNGMVPMRGSADGPLTSVGLATVAHLRRHPTPYLQQYSLDFQYQLSENNAVMVGYYGSQGRKLSYGFNYNLGSLPPEALGPQVREMVPNPFFGVIATPGLFSQRTIERGRLMTPYPQYTSVHALDMPGAFSSYNSLGLTFVRRFSRGMSLNAQYKFSKTIDNASENVPWFNGEASAVRNWYDLSLERAVSSHDAPHSLSVTYVYDLPVGKGRLLGGNFNRLLDAIVGGWSVSGLYRIQSGLPTRFTAPNNIYNFGGVQYPNVTDRKEIKLDNPTRDRWFNPSAFSVPADYTFGNLPRRVTEVRTDLMNNMQMALAKGFRPTEKTRVQFRAEMINAFNHNRFGAPNTDFSPGAVNFGRVSSSLGPPRRIQLTLRVSF